jgi:hypothetical protein
MISEGAMSLHPLRAIDQFLGVYRCYPWPGGQVTADPVAGGA